jgi:hypothetical protein
MIKTPTIKKAAGILILIAATLTACSDDPAGPDMNPEQPGDDLQPLTELPGDPNEPAIDALFDFSVTVDVLDGEISTENEAEIIRTIIEFAFTPGTTVGDINNLLSKYEARIIDMLPDRPFIIVHIPDPGDLPTLRNIIDEIENEESIGAVWEGVIPSSDLLPDHIDATTTLAGSEWVNNEILDRIKHHLAVRGHAAWNLREAIQGQPWLIIQDFFGDGINDGLYASEFMNSNDFGNDNPEDHGYHVLGIINADFEHQTEVTGIFPGRMSVSVSDRTASVMTTSQSENHIVRLIREILDTQSGAKIIVNTSLNHHPAGPVDGARWWGKVVDLQDNFVQFTSAGNIGTRGRTLESPAFANSSFSYAALGDMGDHTPFLEMLLERFDIAAPSNLKNTFVVENRTTNPDFLPFENAKQAERPFPSCTHQSSMMGGNLSAIGTDVFSFAAGGGTLHETGTSMSTPQAAGTAAFMWAVNPSLSVGEIVDLINKTARTPQVPLQEECRSEQPAPVIDTYDAVLAAGGDDARLALLDVTESGSFTEADIEIFLEEFEERDGILDYSRYDLNGTGQTGGSATDRFDLNHDLEYGTVTQNIEDNEVDFNERAVTDTDVLCYYAYSDLYSGDQEQRSELLEPICTSSFKLTSSEFTIEGSCVTFFDDGVEGGGGVQFGSRVSDDRHGQISFLIDFREFRQNSGNVWSVENPEWTWASSVVPNLPSMVTPSWFFHSDDPGFRELEVIQQMRGDESILSGSFQATHKWTEETADGLVVRESEVYGTFRGARDHRIDMCWDGS